jgi:protoheme IX farnesyltransferase
VPMLPVVAGEAETRRQILLYSLVLAPVGMSPWLLGTAGLAYGAAATFGGLVMVVLALQLYLAPRHTAEPVAKRLFGISIVYLFALFAVLIAERALGVQHFGIPFGRVLA